MYESYDEARGHPNSSPRNHGADRRSPPYGMPSPRGGSKTFYNEDRMQPPQPPPQMSGYVHGHPSNMPPTPPSRGRSADSYRGGRGGGMYEPRESSPP